MGTIYKTMEVVVIMNILRILFGIICSILGLIGFKVSFEQCTIIGYALAISCIFCGLYTIIGGC